LDDVPEEIKKSMKFVFVETVDEVLDSALEANHKRSSPVGKSAGSKQASKKKTTSRKTKTNGKNTARRR
jgi:hypothetical protein